MRDGKSQRTLQGLMVESKGETVILEGGIDIQEIVVKGSGEANR